MTYLGGIIVVVRRDAFAGGRPADDITACGLGRPGAVIAAVRTAGAADALARPPNVRAAAGGARRGSDRVRATA